MTFLFNVLLAELPQKINVLSQNLAQGTGFREKALRVYYERVILKLNLILNGSQADFAAFLNENWNHVKGIALPTKT